MNYAQSIMAILCLYQAFVTNMLQGLQAETVTSDHVQLIIQ